MKRISIIVISILCINLNSFAQKKKIEFSPSEIPEDVMEEWTNLTKDGGRWTSTDNGGQYDSWEMTFSWGLGKKSVDASLNAIKDRKNLGSLWKYKMFYHPGTNEVVLEQWSSDGSYGVGTLIVKGNGQSENTSTFYFLNDTQFKIKHEQNIEGDIKYSKVFIQDENGEWKKDRVYTWKRDK